MNDKSTKIEKNFILKELNENIRIINKECQKIKKKILKKRKENSLFQLSIIFSRKYDEYLNNCFNNIKTERCHYIYKDSCGLIFVHSLSKLNDIKYNLNNLKEKKKKKIRKTLSEGRRSNYNYFSEEEKKKNKKKNKENKEKTEKKKNQTYDKKNHHIHNYYAKNEEHKNDYAYEMKENENEYENDMIRSLWHKSDTDTDDINSDANTSTYDHLKKKEKDKLLNNENDSYSNFSDNHINKKLLKLYNTIKKKKKLIKIQPWYYHIYDNMNNKNENKSNIDCSLIKNLIPKEREDIFSPCYIYKCNDINDRSYKKNNRNYSTIETNNSKNVKQCNENEHENEHENELNNKLKIASITDDIQKMEEKKGHIDAYIETIQHSEAFSLLERKKEKKNIVLRFFESLKFFFSFKEYDINKTYDDNDQTDMHILKYQCILKLDKKKIYLCVCPFCAKHFYLLIKKGAGGKWKYKMLSAFQVTSIINNLRKNKEETAEEKDDDREENKTENKKLQQLQHSKIEIGREKEMQMGNSFMSNKSKMDSIFQMYKNKDNCFEDYSYQSSLFHEKKNNKDTCCCYIKMEEDNYLENFDLLFYI